LNTASEGSKGALKALGSALVGPAGLFLAFSAVTSIVTVAVQKYGSLGGAIDALFGRLSPLNDLTQRTAKSLAEYNQNLVTNEEALGQASGSMQGQILKAKTLAGIILNLSESEDARKRALSQLKELDNDRFEAFDIEKGKLEGLKTAVDNYTSSILANAVAQKFTERVSSAAEQLENQRNLYAQIINKIDELKSKGVDKQAQNLKSLNAEAAKFGAEPIAPSDDIRLFEDLNIQLNQQEVILKNVASAYENASSTARGYIDAAARLSTIKTPEGKKPGTGGTGKKSVFSPQIDSQALDEAFNLDKIISNLTKYGNVLIDVNKTEAERKNALRELSEINPEYFNQFKIGKSSVADAKVQIEDFIRALLAQKKAQEDSLAAAKLNNDFRKNEEKGITAVGDKYRIFKDEISTLPETIEDVEKSFRNATLNADKLFKLDFSKFDTSFDFDQLSKGFKIIEEQSRKIKDNMVSALSVIQGLLQDTFLQLFDEGKGNWKEFGDAAVKEIKRITAALVAKALVEGLANLLSAGISGTAKSVVEGLKEIDTASLGEWLDITPQANFGGIRGNQGVNMNGQVVMTLRGTDLVGAMNRTNTSINRVG
jgi:hypothetical protein